MTTLLDELVAEPEECLLWIEYPERLPDFHHLLAKKVFENPNIVAPASRSVCELFGRALSSLEAKVLDLDWFGDLRSDQIEVLLPRHRNLSAISVRGSFTPEVMEKFISHNPSLKKLVIFHSPKISLLSKVHLSVAYQVDILSTEIFLAPFLDHRVLPAFPNFTKSDALEETPKTHSTSSFPIAQMLIAVRGTPGSQPSTQYIAWQDTFSELDRARAVVNLRDAMLSPNKVATFLSQFLLYLSRRKLHEDCSFSPSLHKLVCDCISAAPSFPIDSLYEVGPMPSSAYREQASEPEALENLTPGSEWMIVVIEEQGVHRQCSLATIVNIGSDTRYRYALVTRKEVEGQTEIIVAGISTFLEETLKGPAAEETHRMLMEYWDDNLEKVRSEFPAEDQPDVLQLCSEEEVWSLYSAMCRRPFHKVRRAPRLLRDRPQG